MKYQSDRVFVVKAEWTAHPWTSIRPRGVFTDQGRPPRAASLVILPFRVPRGLVTWGSCVFWDRDEVAGPPTFWDCWGVEFKKDGRWRPDADGYLVCENASRYEVDDDAPVAPPPSKNPMRIAPLLRGAARPVWASSTDAVVDLQLAALHRNATSITYNIAVVLGERRGAPFLEYLADAAAVYASLFGNPDAPHPYTLTEEAP